MIRVARKNRTFAIAAFTASSILIIFSFIISSLLSTSANAADTTDFKAGYIISDSIFTNDDTMSVSKIQTFLNSKVPTCDTTGSQNSEMNNTGVPDYNGNGSIQRWEWGKAKYSQTTFTCLKSYSQGGKSAAQIIYDKAKKYSINPQVLIVLLQKEQALVTDTWPLNVQYRSATGYACPDTAACDSEYYGFTNQLDNAAKMFRAIMNDSPTWYTPYELGNNSIKWHPSDSCGSSTVNIQNRSTQALYNYTPYRPNQAALSAGYGSGDSCSSYGNRNFFLYFTDWFGSTTATYDAGVTAVSLYSNSTRTTPLTSSGGVYQLTPGQTIYGTVQIKNLGSKTLDQSFTRIGTTDPTDRGSDFYNTSWLTGGRIAQLNETSIAPTAQGTFSISLTAPRDLGSFTEDFGVVAEGKTWMDRDSISLKFNITPSKSYDVNLSSYDVFYDPEMKAKASPPYVLRPDQKLYVKAKYKNIGSATLTGSLLKIAPTNPQDHTDSPYLDDTWNSTTRVVNTTESSVPSGSIATFIFALHAPSTPGNYSDSFGAVLETVTWIDTSKLSVDLTVDSTAPIFHYGESLRPGQSLATSNGYRLVFQHDGNLVIYKGSTPLWATETNDEPADRVTLQTDGNLVMYSTDNRPLWASWTQGTGLSRLQQQSDGNLVLYKNGASFSWASWTNK